MDKNGCNIWTQRLPKPQYPLQTSTPHKSCIPVIFGIVIISGITRGLSQGGNLAKMGPLASTQKKLAK